MRILLTTDTYYPMINGVVISTNNLYKELKKKGHDVRIMALSDTGDEKIEGDVYYLKSIKVKIYQGSRIKNPLCSKLVKELVEWCPHVVHSQTEFSTMIVAKYIVRKTGALHVHTYHTMYEDYLKYFLGGKVIKPNAARKMIKLLLQSIKCIIVPTNKVKSTLLEYGVTRDIRIAPTGIDLSRFKIEITEDEKHKLLKSCGLSEDNNILVYVGRIAEEKNIQEVINFFASSIKYVENIKLVIVGGGPYVEVLKKEAENVNCSDNVIFTGMVAPEDVYKYYKIGDAFVTSSVSETQGLTYAEAMASGLPLICRYDPCVDGVLINGENGYMYTNEQQFIDVVEKFFEYKNIKEKMSKYSLEKAEDFSCERFGQNVEKIYNEQYSKWIENDAQYEFTYK